MKVYVIPVGNLDRRIIENITDVLDARYSLETEIETPRRYRDIDLDIASTEAPYSAERILRTLTRQRPGALSVAVTRLPITHNGRESLFGLANSDMSSCIVSTYRLFQGIHDNTYTDPQTAMARIRKEVLHEVGHVLGYTHCRNQHCVMNFSIDVASVDNKPEQLCRECRMSLSLSDDTGESLQS
jgi:archaemetzincin